mmetsp:Transcript_10585/g.12127  ORF Transcript_10585/g.12127 Transcript_10585/m.12127 type:complete len:83 (-) Transcript_10585:40-288(-)
MQDFAEGGRGVHECRRHHQKSDEVDRFGFYQSIEGKHDYQKSDRSGENHFDQIDGRRTGLIGRQMSADVQFSTSSLLGDAIP